MPDTVDSKVIRNGRVHVIHLQSRSDGTGEAGVAKIAIATLLTPDKRVATYSAIDRIEYSVFGMNHVRLDWDHTSDDEIATLSGSGLNDWSVEGGKVDPRSAGGTGNIVLTTNGATSGGGYDITIWLRPKA